MRNFHDSTVTDFALVDGDLIIRIEDVWVFEHGTESQESGVVVVKDLSSLHEEGKAVSAPTLASDDACVLELKFDGGELWALLEWEHYQPLWSQVAEYRAMGREVVWVPDSDNSRPGSD